MPFRFFALAVSCPVLGSTPHSGHSVASSGIAAPHLGHMAWLLSTTLSRSRRARKSPLSGSSTFLAGALAPALRAMLLPSPADDSPAGTLTLVSQPGHLIAFPRAASGAFSTFSHVGQRTLTAIVTF